MIYILTIAGSDSCGGAGIQADIKTIHRLGAHALTAVTAVTAQNSVGVAAIHPVPASFLSKQVEVLVTDVFPHAVKLGMLCSAEAVREVARLITRHGLSNVVLDPVFRASTGQGLLEGEEAWTSLREELLPLVHIVTPNLEEASILTGKKVQTLEEAEAAAQDLHAAGPDVVVTGGHLPEKCTDVLCDDSGLVGFEGDRLNTPFSHGTGCVFSSALATFVAEGHAVRDAVVRARTVVRKALHEGYPCGKGRGVVNPLGGVSPDVRESESGSKDAGRA
ncbi:MAG: bifunctional hydroxymethylpyrimidine kinase/phosphomethylpyrimidine kinase [Desulfobacteraceae bacterium]|jgi:hydroxymethylpyrimidine/phosphomethylpyrimidine kinase